MFLSMLLYMNLCISGWDRGWSKQSSRRRRWRLHIVVSVFALKLIRPLSLSLPPPLRHRGNHLSLWIFRINAHRTCFVFPLTNPFVSQPAASVISFPPPPNFLPCSLHPHFTVSPVTFSFCSIPCLPPPFTLYVPFTPLCSSFCPVPALC